MTRVIHHTFGPLADGAQRRQALSLLLQCWKWRDGAAVEQLRHAIGDALGGSVTLYDAGRTGLLALLRAAGIGDGDEVIVQGYTCIVVPNAIVAAGAVPIYADIAQDTLNLDLEAVRTCLSPRTRAIICQHTFGIPADLPGLRALCDAHHLLLIEDCAHVLPDHAGPAGVARTGDAVLLSFGRDKAISGVSGGAICCRRNDIAQRLRALEDGATHHTLWTIKRLLLYPLLYSLARPLYAAGPGKYFLYACRRLHLLLPIVTETEKRGRQPATLHRLPAACAALALNQWRHLAEINAHRRQLTSLYLSHARSHGWTVPAAVDGQLPLQKVPLFVTNAKGLRKRLEAHGMYLDDGWTGCVVCPASVDIDQTRYESGSDPQAEAACQAILSLPTHPGTTVQDAERLLATLDPLLPPH